MDKYVIAPPSGSTNNSVGASDRPWKEGHFDSVKLNGGDLGEYLAESTGYGIVSGCEPTISGLTVTVASGIVHLADGTRKEISASSITLDAADSTNPRVDIVYITSAGVVAKVTGTAAASPSAPSVPSNGISVAQVSVAANATVGTLTDKRDRLARWYNTGVVNVKDFGAVGDGVTDDTAAIQAAIDSSDNIFFPAGTYMIYGTGDSYSEMGLRLHSNMFVYMDKNATLKCITMSSAYYVVMNCYEVENVTIWGGNILGERTTHTGSSGQHGLGIDVRNGHNIKIKDVNISDCWGDGIYVGATYDNDAATWSKNVIIEDCVINNNRRQGISITAGDFVTISNCYISNTNGTSPQAGIDVEPNQNIHCKNVKIVNCNFVDNVGAGVQVYQNGYDDSVYIESCAVSNTNESGAGYLIRYSNAQLTNCVCEIPGTTRIALTCEASILKANNCKFKYVVTNYNAAHKNILDFFNCEISNRIALWEGEACFSSCTINDATLTFSNTAQTVVASFFGCIFLNLKTDSSYKTKKMIIHDCSFEQNKSITYGLSLSSDYIELANNTFHTDSYEGTTLSSFASLTSPEVILRGNTFENILDKYSNRVFYFYSIDYLDFSNNILLMDEVTNATPMITFSNSTPSVGIVKNNVSRVNVVGTSNQFTDAKILSNVSFTTLKDVSGNIEVSAS